MQRFADPVVAEQVTTMYASAAVKVHGARTYPEIIKDIKILLSRMDDEQQRTKKLLLKGNRERWKMRRHRWYTLSQSRTRVNLRPTEAVAGNLGF